MSLLFSITLVVNSHIEKRALCRKQLTIYATKITKKKTFRLSTCKAQIHIRHQYIYIYIAAHLPQTQTVYSHSTKNKERNIYKI